MTHCHTHTPLVSINNHSSNHHNDIAHPTPFHSTTCTHTLSHLHTPIYSCLWTQLRTYSQTHIALANTRPWCGSGIPSDTKRAREDTQGHHLVLLRDPMSKLIIDFFPMVPGRAKIIISSIIFCPGPTGVLLQTRSNQPTCLQHRSPKGSFIFLQSPFACREERRDTVRR